LLDWSRFAVLIHEDQWESTFTILEEISAETYAAKKRNLRQVLKHFCYHKKPFIGDAFYMSMLLARRRLEAKGISVD
jgi:hypothetical protein